MIRYKGIEMPSYSQVFEQKRIVPLETSLRKVTCNNALMNSPGIGHARRLGGGGRKQWDYLGNKAHSHQLL
jgi:hypothetical protein